MDLKEGGWAWGLQLDQDMDQWRSCCCVHENTHFSTESSYVRFVLHLVNILFC